jgi:hypothetical protein
MVRENPKLDPASRSRGFDVDALADLALCKRGLRGDLEAGCGALIGEGNLNILGSLIRRTESGRADRS